MKLQKMAARTLSDDTSRRLAICCLFLMTGFGVGMLLQSVCFRGNYSALHDYFAGYILFADSASLAQGTVRLLLLYLRWPLALLFLRVLFDSPYLSAFVFLIVGSSIGFSLGCFAGCLGRSGVLLAFAAFGIRSLCTLPVMLAIGSGLAAARGQKRSQLFILCVGMMAVGFFTEILASADMVTHILKSLS